MNVHINQLVKSLLKKDSIEQCSLQELQQFADSNPHFGAAQLLLTKKLKAENSDRYNEQLQKTFLYFHNPLWVEHLLNETGGAIFHPSDKINPVADTAPAEKEIPAAENISIADMQPDDANKPVLEEVAPVQPLLAATTTTESPEAEKQMINPALQMEPAKDELLFEPYHTVDYFASQGIKLKEEDKGTDKFSEQLRSFTDWLKTLKKAPVAEITKQPVSVTEKKVEQMAAHSIQDGEVVTETMAEVWEKQGNTVKAIDLYSKLSLLEPAKSTYFAAKIEELKKQL